MKSKFKKYIAIGAAVIAAIMYIIFNRKISAPTSEIIDVVSDATDKSKQEAAVSLLDAAESEAAAMTISEEQIKENIAIDEMDESEFLKRMNR